MKKPLLTLALVAASFAAVAQTAPATATTVAAPATSPYAAMMQVTIKEMMSATDKAQLQQSIAKMERAAAVAPQDWLPRYYQAHAYVRLGFATQESDAQDKIFDQAQAALDQARQLPGADVSEVSVVQAYLYQGRIMVAPMTRAMSYTGRVQEALEAAEKANPANPRTYLVRGNDLKFRPKMFGGGDAAARPFYDKAKVAFAAFRPATVISPTWGERQLEGILKSYDTAAAVSAK